MTTPNPTFLHEVPSLASRPGYLFHCGVAPITRRAAEALELCAHELTTDPWSTFTHRLKRIHAARSAAARLINAPSAQDVAFVKSTTHGLLLVAQSLDWDDGDCIIVEETTFPANWYAWTPLFERCGVRVIPWPERAHRYELEDLERLLARHTVRMVALSAADYATGFRHDLHAVGTMIKNAGAWFCLDAIQAVGCLPVDVQAIQADFLSADGHKWMLGPEGAGILYVNPEMHPELNDSMSGWLGRERFQEYENRRLAPPATALRFEEGALNIPGNLALGGSLELLNEVGMETIWERVQANRAAVVQWGAEQGLKLISHYGPENQSGIVAFEFPKGVQGDSVVKRAAERGVIVSSRRGFLRIAPHFYQEPEHVREALRVLGDLLR